VLELVILPDRVHHFGNEQLRGQNHIRLLQNACEPGGPTAPASRTTLTGADPPE
jgi:hypothetical protein